jgi:hypothetical protein
MAYAMRRAEEMLNVPSLLLGRDIEDMKTKAGIERAVLSILRRFGVLPPEPPKAPPLKLVKSTR